MWDLSKFDNREPQQCLSYRFEVLVKLGQVFALTLCAFIVDFRHSLFTVNVVKFYVMAYICGTPNSRCNYESYRKTLACNCAND